MENHRKRIKNKIIQVSPDRWWGDDFDVRFLLISKLTKIKDKVILDIGGGIGIILSELDDSNMRINLDFSFSDLLVCKNLNDGRIENVCGSMTHLPFRDESFDYVIAANILEIGKEQDLKNNNIQENGFPTINRMLNEIRRIIKVNGRVFLTTPNNAFYKTIKLSYNELKSSIVPFFSEPAIFFYNTFPKIHPRFRKLNLANVIPKVLSKIIKDELIILLLCKTHSRNNYSVSFFIEIIKRIN